MFKVGDFVYYKSYSEWNDNDFGYGYVYDIKFVEPDAFCDEARTHIYIEAKYTEDGCPILFDKKIVIDSRNVNPAEIAIEEREKELQRQMDNIKEIRKEFINEAK